MSEKETFNTGAIATVEIENAAVAGNWDDKRIEAVKKNYEVSAQGQKELAAVEKHQARHDADFKDGLGITALNVTPENNVALDEFASNDSVDQERLAKVQDQLTK